MATGHEARGWGRSDLTLKLSKRRLEQMKRIASGLPESATPTDAIDHALSATLAHGAIEDRLDALEEALVDWAAEHRSDVDRIEAAIAALSKGIEGLHALISAVAESEDY
jgi:hypothetical protein